jgi:uncharacterized protein (UPF0332 family)
MALSDDLLEQAYILANLDLPKPKQANLRRAISSAYYSLFHLLTTEGSQRMSPKRPIVLAPRIARAFAHSEMKQVCRVIYQSNRSVVLDSIHPEGFSTEIRLVAEIFVELQDQRLLADYDLTINFDLIRVIELLDSASAAFFHWQKIRLAEEANVFLAALLFGGRWAK